MSFNILKYFQDGGPMMYPLLLLWIVAIAVAVERAIMIIMIKRKVSPADFMKKMDTIMEKESDKTKISSELIAFCKQRGGPVAEIMLEGLTKYQEAVKNGLSMKESKEWIDTAVAEKGTVEVPTLEKNLMVLSTIATVAPLTGLLGTVTGMIVAFNTMADSAGGAKPDELAGGISQALITTATGMIIAIPVLILYNYLRSVVDNMVLQMEEVAIVMTDKLIEK